MLERLVANSRKGGKTSRPNAPERISPKHAAILVTRAADQITEAWAEWMRDGGRPAQLDILRQRPGRQDGSSVAQLRGILPESRRRSFLLAQGRPDPHLPPSISRIAELLPHNWKPSQA